MTDLTEDDAPIERATPSLAWRLIRFLLLCGLAFVGGLGATYAYSRVVEAPAADAPVVPFVPPAPAPLALPSAEPAPVSTLDPVRQALTAVRPKMPDSAVLDVSIRRNDALVYLEGQADSRRTIARAAEAVAAVPGVDAVDTLKVRLIDRVHVVEGGDNPRTIARKYYGSSAFYKTVIDANPRLKRGVMHPGDELKIPPLDR